VGYYGSANAL
jgi:hypothetical protein